MINAENALISQSLEDYLEAIYTLAIRQTSVRITDIALHLNISKPSVNRAVNSLKTVGLVSHEPYGDIYLTDEGMARGKMCYDKHITITKFFVNILKLEPSAAETEANKIEHILSSDTVESMVKYMKN